MSKNLNHVYWMGGAPCSGKSSIADLIADRYGLLVYHCDEAFPEHVRGISPISQPCMHKWTNTPWEALWNQSLDMLLDEAIACYREHFDYILRDLIAVPQSERVLVEGNPLMPDLVDRYLTDPIRAIWLIPSDAFLRGIYPQRGQWVKEIVNQCQNPELCLNKWMDRDVAFAHWVNKNARDRDYKILNINGNLTISENAELVAAQFRLTPSSGGEV
ncbi:MAG: hypothetical protein PVF74_14080 [Anaerolineales bacterium]|jgi:2-phosphoglycerate kinase